MYDGAPDGRFLMMRPAPVEAPEPAAAGEPAEQPRVVLVLNWLEELKTKMGGAG